MFLEDDMRLLQVLFMFYTIAWCAWSNKQSCIQSISWRVMGWGGDWSSRVSYTTPLSINQKWCCIGRDQICLSVQRRRVSTVRGSERVFCGYIAWFNETINLRHDWTFGRMKKSGELWPAAAIRSLVIVARWTRARVRRSFANTIRVSCY